MAWDAENDGSTVWLFWARHVKWWAMCPLLRAYGALPEADPPGFRVYPILPTPWLATPIFARELVRLSDRRFYLARKLSGGGSEEFAAGLEVRPIVGALDGGLRLLKQDRILASAIWT